MARANPAGRSWAEWFGPRYRATGLSGSELAEHITKAGGKASKQSVSQWDNGLNAADANTVVIIAALFGEDPVAALRAAGFGMVADAMAAGTPQLVGAPPAPPDPGVMKILALAEAEGLPESTQAILIKWWRRVADDDEARRVATAEQMIALRRGVDTA